MVLLTLKIPEDITFMLNEKSLPYFFQYTVARVISAISTKFPDPGNANQYFVSSSVRVMASNDHSLFLKN